MTNRAVGGGTQTERLGGGVVARVEKIEADTGSPLVPLTYAIWKAGREEETPPVIRRVKHARQGTVSQYLRSDRHRVGIKEVGGTHGTYSTWAIRAQRPARYQPYTFKLVESLLLRRSSGELGVTDQLPWQGMKCRVSHCSMQSTVAGCEGARY